MKIFYTAFLLLALVPLGAQVADKSVTDCAGTTNSIYSVLGSGKVLVVASKGLDCSICKSSAPAVQNFAAQNVGSIEVWGAMTFTYNSNTPTCAQVSNWVSTYSWTDVFSFVDSDRHWYMTGTPRYLVYDPADSSLAYVGANRSLAFQTAKSLVSSVGRGELDFSDINIINVEQGVEVQNLPAPISYDLYSLTGMVVLEGNLDRNENRVGTAGLKSGIYLLKLSTKAGEGVVRKIYVN